MMAALAAAEAIEAETGLAASLKWPNDVLLGSSPNWRKVGGILLEGELAQDRLQSAIVGIGLNVNLTPDQLPPAAFPPTSLLIESGRPISRLALLATLLSCLETHYEAARQGHSPQPAWNNRLITVGQRVRAAQQPAGPPLEGFVEGTNEWGHLLLRDDSGQLHLIAAGDVSLRLV
jgi:BirA family biotin operon repressor/biotin-[acetyl-CoA-carboxylase] ligase